MKKRIVAILLVLAALACMFPSALAVEDTNAEKPLEGKYISVMGDSISTYMGWSDSRPISDESCAYRYGEPYYGPVGSDCHNTELLVEDTWWHQAAEELGAEILVSNAGNSTGVMWATYKPSAEWEQYLKDLLAYKSRPYHLGTETEDPDIIALYIGSSDVSRYSVSQFGDISDIDFEKLITKNTDGTYTYTEPETVAEAYSIMLHKVQNRYPGAEIYCFEVVPNSGGYLSTCNSRLASVVPFNRMIEGVAAHFGAYTVDLLEAFQLDPDGDGVAVQEDLDEFKTCYNGDPHPNAKGFDVITDAFVEAVTENSKFIVEVETTAGKLEYIDVTRSSSGNTVNTSAKGFVTKNNMTVDYAGEETTYPNGNWYFKDEYTSENADKTYTAKGGSEKSVEYFAPKVELNIPMTTDEDNSGSYINGRPEGSEGKKGEINDGDGTYNYTESAVIKQGKLTLKTKSLDIVEEVICDAHEGLTYVKNDVKANGSNNMITNVTAVVEPENAEQVPEIKDGYEYVYIGSDQLSQFWATYAYESDDPEAYPNETPIYSDEKITLYTRYDHSVFINRALVVPKLYLRHGTFAVDPAVPGWYDSVQQFTLSDKNANLITTYCADQKTPAVRGYSYKLVNLEDANYYSEQEAWMIRSIVNNGYWGQESGIGSLAQMRERLRATGNFTEDELASITDGMAMTATQYAIWTHSNIMDEMVFYSTYYTTKSKTVGTVAEDEDVALIFKIYNYLLSLDPTNVASDERTTRNTLINEKNFLDGVSVKLTGKPMDNENNLDADKTNDVYTADVLFELSVTPCAANGDDLVMKIMGDDDNDPIAIGRIAGEPKEGEIVLTSVGGKYAFENVTIQEGTQNISFVLSGTQVLAKTPHLFISEERDGETSQTLVGIAEGPRKVNISMLIEFDVEVEDEGVSNEHCWRSEKTTPPSKDEPDPEPPKPVSPPTGDDSELLMWITAAAAGVIGIGAVYYKRKVLKK